MKRDVKIYIDGKLADEFKLSQDSIELMFDDIMNILVYELEDDNEDDEYPKDWDKPIHETEDDYYGFDL